MKKKVTATALVLLLLATGPFPAAGAEPAADPSSAPDAVVAAEEVAARILAWTSVTDAMRRTLLIRAREGSDVAGGVIGEAALMGPQIEPSANQVLRVLAHLALLTQLEPAQPAGRPAGMRKADVGALVAATSPPDPGFIPPQAARDFFWSLAGVGEGLAALADGSITANVPEGELVGHLDTIAKGLVGLAEGSRTGQARKMALTGHAQAVTNSLAALTVTLNLPRVPVAPSNRTPSWASGPSPVQLSYPRTVSFGIDTLIQLFLAGARAGENLPNQATGTLAGAAAGAAKGSVLGPGGTVAGALWGAIGGFMSQQARGRALKDQRRAADIRSQEGQLIALVDFWSVALGAFAYDTRAYQEFGRQQLAMITSGPAPYCFEGICGTDDQQEAVVKVGSALLLREIQKVDPRIVDLDQVDGFRSAYIDFIFANTFREDHGGLAPFNDISQFGGLLDAAGLERRR